MREKKTTLMQSTFHFNSSSEISTDILDAIKIAYKGKAVVITVEEIPSAEDVPEWHKKMVMDRLQEVQENPDMILSEEAFQSKVQLLNK